MKKRSVNVLRYTEKPAHRETVGRHFQQWREARDLPLRCDNPSCFFHTNPLFWNGQKLPLILDHKNGNNSDNRPENLQLLCSNCNSQLDTHGGRNIGRVKKSEGGFALVSKPDGVHHYVLPAEGGEFRFSGSDTVLVIENWIDQEDAAPKGK